MRKPDNENTTLVESEQESLVTNSGAAYALEQGTSPSTIGFVLSSSPLALLAWYAVPYPSHVLYAKSKSIPPTGLVRSFSHGLTTPTPGAHPRVRHIMLVHQHFCAMRLPLPRSSIPPSLPLPPVQSTHKLTSLPSPPHQDGSVSNKTKSFSKGPDGYMLHSDPQYHSSKPLGYSIYPKEIYPIPKSWSKKQCVVSLLPV